MPFIEAQEAPLQTLFRSDHERITTAKILQELHLCKPIKDSDEHNGHILDNQEPLKRKMQSTTHFPPFKKRHFCLLKSEKDQVVPFSSDTIPKQEKMRLKPVQISPYTNPSNPFIRNKQDVYKNTQIMSIIPSNQFNFSPFFQRNDARFYPTLMNKPYASFDCNKNVNIVKYPYCLPTNEKKEINLPTIKLTKPTHVPQVNGKTCIEKKCRMDSCNKPAAKRTPYCTFHRGVRKCEHAGCKKCAQGRTRFCIAHGGGRRCMHPDCSKAARDKKFCAAHGGGKRCSEAGCNRLALVTGNNSELKCTAHGGGKRCQKEGCVKSAQSGTSFCVRHGGGKRCLVHGCMKVARGKTMLCMAHRRNFASSLGANVESIPWQDNILFCRPVLVGSNNTVEAKYQESN